MSTKNSGFTLVELSIVLVIIGLVIGGVIFGRELVKVGDIQKQISDVAEFEAAAVTFKLKFDCLPGDCERATVFFDAGSEPDQVRNGDGDGRISDRGSVTSSTSWFTFTHEWGQVWDHLAAAKLVKLAQYNGGSPSTDNFTGISMPAVRFDAKAGSGGFGGVKGGMIMGFESSFHHNRGGHRIRLGVCGDGTNGAQFYCGIDVEDVGAMDEKMDDGHPYTGNFVLMGYGPYTYRIPGSGLDYTSQCADSTTNTYKYTNPGNQHLQFGCSPSIKTSLTN